MFSFAAPPPLSLYIHLPWCVHKCPYCDFNSYELDKPLPQQAYMDALIRDLEAASAGIEGRVIESIFIGGGTPSLFEPAHIAALLNAVQARTAVSAQAEITLEANPGTFEQQRFAGFRDAGVNRLSLGVQSLDDNLLKAIGRIHDRDAALAAMGGAREAGFDNINVDLMYGLPGQALDRALADIDEVAALGPEHLSHYQLTLEPQTYFYHHPPVLPDDDTLWSMQCHCQSRLAAHGYQHYEISAYARAGHECRHNLNYWRFGDYLGIGAGAHGKLTDTNNRHIVRYHKSKQPGAYMQHAGTPRCCAESRVLTREDAVFEFMMNAMRLVQGVPSALFAQRTGLEMAAMEEALQSAAARGLLRHDSQTLCVTSTGMRYLNDLLQLFLPEPA